jgi:NitT/TauT family transport system substrate-binding protein
MAVRIEKGGWIVIGLIGVGLVGYSLQKYGVLDLVKPGSSKGSSAGAKVDPAKPLPASASNETNEVRVRLNIWVGCVGGLVANGGLDTAAGSIYAGKGLKVSFKIIDDWTEGSAALASNNVDIMLTTADVWGKDFGQFQEKGVNAHAVYMVDWSRGADGVIGRQGINSIEDLAGKTVAFAPYTPSHFLFWNGLKGSGLSTEQRNEIFSKAVHTKDGIEPATLFAQQKVDAAVAWDPDMSDAVAKRPGSRKIYDTRVANRLIADILVVSDRFAASSPGTLTKFIQGWLEGVEFIQKQPSRAHTLIGTIKDFNIPADLAKTMLEGVHLSDYADNQSFFGTPGSDSDYANIFKMSQEMYRELRLVKRVRSEEHTSELQSQRV